MKVKIKKLHADAVIPSYAKDGDAGMDLTAISVSVGRILGEWDVPNSQLGLPLYVEYGTGLSIEIPKGFVGLVFPRSSISVSALLMANSVGVIDSGYRGEIKVRFKVLNLDDFQYKVGDRVAQLIIIPHPNIQLIETNELADSERGVGGYGSTGL